MGTYPEDLPTVKAIKKQYGGMNNLEIIEHPDYPGRVQSFSYSVLCISCDGYHDSFEEYNDCFIESMKVNVDNEYEYNYDECPHCDGTGRIDWDD